MIDKEYLSQVKEIINDYAYEYSNMLPSEWVEKHRKMTTDTSPFPGKFSYDRTPYTREIVNCLSPEHPARVVAVMKGSQIGISTGLIESGIGWLIAQNPCNILFLAGDKDLAKEAVTGKIDQMIQSCGIQKLIKPNIVKARNQRTGDTNAQKEFPGGKMIVGSTQNANKFRQRSMQVGFVDDFEAAPTADKSAGSIRSLIETRFDAFYNKMKLYYISTPEIKQTSNIEPAYLLGDQRKFHVPCPCCGDYIALEWQIKIDNKTFGITWELDNHGKVIDSSVGYICQSCGGFFTDAKKYEMNLQGIWKPTAEPSEEGYYSYHISSLYAPPGMYDWQYYVKRYVECHPHGEPVDVAKAKTFYNTVLGMTWEDRGESPKASKLAMNTRTYDVELIPNELSKADGNGNIVLLTCAADLNGVVDDARIDYEVVAWSESGASYSVDHGSIGTFIPRENTLKVKPDRERWTYKAGKNSVWPVFKELLEKNWQKEDGKKMKIMMSGLDTGHYTNYAYDFIDAQNAPIVGLKGSDIEKTRRFGADTPPFKRARERNNLYIVEVNQVKDDLASLIKLKWDEGDESQPPGFMNFPSASGGKYAMKNYFSHYEAEHKIMEQSKEGKEVGYKWVKRNAAAQNHMFDCRVYNMVVKDLFAHELCKEAGVKYPDWGAYVQLIFGKYKG